MDDNNQTRLQEIIKKLSVENKILRLSVKKIISITFVKFTRIRTFVIYILAYLA